MKQTIYFLKDPLGEIRARVTSHEKTAPELEPWMQHQINNSGWRLEEAYGVVSVADAHGMVDWEAVADQLAYVLKGLVDEDTDLDEEQTEAMLEMAGDALTNYDVAHMEASLGRVDIEPDEDDEDGPEEESEDART